MLDETDFQSAVEDVLDFEFPGLSNSLFELDKGCQLQIGQSIHTSELESPLLSEGTSSDMSSPRSSSSLSPMSSLAEADNLDVYPYDFETTLQETASWRSEISLDWSKQQSDPSEIDFCQIISVEEKGMLPPTDKKSYKKYKRKLEFEPMLPQLLGDNQVMENIQKSTKKRHYRCSHCDSQFYSLFDYVAHLDELQTSRKHKCQSSDCPYKIIGFPRKADLTRHNVCAHAAKTVEPKYVCQFDHCVKSFNRKDIMRRHEKLVHLNENSRFNTRMGRLKDRMSKKRDKVKNLAFDYDHTEGFDLLMAFNYN